MREVERIARQLRASVDGPAWHGPSVLEALKGVSAVRAAAKPLPKAHSIYEITHHIAAWMDVVRRRMEGEANAQPEGGNFAEEPLTPKRWRETQRHVVEASAALIGTVRRLKDSELDRPLRRGRPPRYVFLHGVVQHNLYHAGQIVLLRRR